MLIDGISREQLKTLAIRALLEARTLAGPRVFTNKDWPTSPDLFPMLLVQAPRERKASLFPGMLEFTTTIALAVVGRIVGHDPEVIGNALDRLSEQVSNGLLLGLHAVVQQFSVVDTQFVLTAEAKQHIGEIGMTFEVDVYQAYGPDGPPLTNITGEIDIVGGTPGDVPPITIDMLPSPIIQST